MIKAIGASGAGLLIALVVNFAACAHTPAVGERAIQVQASPIPLDPLNTSEKNFGELVYIGGLALSSNARGFGGFSGLEISPDGEQLTAVSDGGRWMTARIQSSDGVPTGLTDVRLSPLLTPTKLPVKGSWVDAEGLARTPSGKLLVSFERRHRLWIYDEAGNGPKSIPKPVRVPVEVKDIRFNKGLEGITFLQDGRLLMLTEQTFDLRNRLIGWLETDKGFENIYVKPSGIFHITDLARLQGGDILMLERRYTIMGGPGMQIRRIAKDDILPGEELDGPVLIELGSRYNIDNMEGLAVRHDPAGGSILYILSDDNFSDVQRTLLIVFKLP